MDRCCWGAGARAGGAAWGRVGALRAGAEPRLDRGMVTIWVGGSGLKTNFDATR